MSGTHSPHIPYDPLPLTQDPFYRARDTPSPSFDTHPVELTSLPETMSADASPPRFLPAARHFQGAEYRDSFASQSTFQTAPSAPNASAYALHRESAADSSGYVYRDDPGLSTPDLAGPPRYLEEKRSAYSSPRSQSKRRMIVLGSIVAAILVLVVVIVPVCLELIKSKANNDAAEGTPSAPSGGGTGSGSKAVVTGGNGSTITTENGTTFTYINPFGGTWYWDPNNPFNNNAQPNSWTPPLNQSFKFGIDRIFGFVPFAASSHISH